jgi:hypothetical protein
LKSDEEIIRAFYKTDRIAIEGKKLFWNVSDNIAGLKVSKDILHPKTKEVILHAWKEDHEVGFRSHQTGQGGAV